MEKKIIPIKFKIIVLVSLYVTMILIIDFSNGGNDLRQDVEKSYATDFDCIVNRVSTHNGLIDVKCKSARLYTDTGTAIESERFLENVAKGDSISKKAMSRTITVFKRDINNEFTKSIEFVVYGSYHEK